MKVIFLDVDGVLNSSDFADKMREEENVNVFYEDMLDKRAIFRLKRIVDTTGALIVLSSSWRLIERSRMAVIDQLQSAAGLQIEDVTPKITISGSCRGDEIMSWLIEHPDIERIVILDDDSDMSCLSDFLVQTTFKSGLKKEHAMKAISILNGTDAINRPWRKPT